MFPKTKSFRQLASILAGKGSALNYRENLTFPPQIAFHPDDFLPNVCVELLTGKCAIFYQLSHIIALTALDQ